MEEIPNQTHEPPCPTVPNGEELLPRSQPLEYYQPPRLGIIHLLAWVTVAAVLFKFNLVLEMFQIDPTRESEIFKFIAKLIQAGHVILSAATVVGGVVFWLDRLRRKPGKLQPGHWIVGISSLAIPACLFIESFSTWLEFGNDYASYRTLFLCYAVLMLPMSWFSFLGARRLPGPRRWKCALGLFGLENLVFALYHLSLAFPSWEASSKLCEAFSLWISLAQYFVAAFLILVNLLDLFKGQCRDWLHWLGAIQPIVVGLFYLAWKLADAFLSRIPPPLWS